MRSSPAIAATVSRFGGQSGLGGYLLPGVGLRDGLALLAGANPDCLLDREDEDLAVADLAGAGMPEDRLDHRGLVLVPDHNLQLQLRAHVDRQARAAVVLDHPLLAPGALG